MIRQATGERTLGYQIAPGHSEVSTATIRELDLIAARVAYLVDGDAAGRKRAKQLIDAGVPPERVFSLSSTQRLVVLEDLLPLAMFTKAVNAELQQRHGLTMPTDRFDRDHRWQSVNTWCHSKRTEKDAAVKVSKRAVAHRLLELGHDSPLVAAEHKKRLAALHSKVLATLATPLSFAGRPG